MKYLLLFLLSMEFTFAYINIHPISFDKRIDKGGSYQEYTLYNSRNIPIMYRIYVDSDGDEPSMAEHMDVYPRSMTLQAGETKKIQVHIQANDTISSGEYSAVIGVREIPIYHQEVKSKVGVSILTDFRLVINGYAGDIGAKLKLDKIELEHNEDKIKLLGEIENSGKKRGRFEIFADEHFLGNIRVMSGENLNFGDYSFQMEKNGKKITLKEIIIKDFDTKEVVIRKKI